MTYYVVAQMGRVGSDSFIEIDYMLETIVVLTTIDYLLLKIFYLNGFIKKKPIDTSGSFNLLLNNQNNNQMILSAGNFLESSETIRQFSNLFFSYIKGQTRQNLRNYTKKILTRYEVSQKETNFAKWLAGIIDGDGNFDIRKCPKTKKHILKAIRIKIHNRDIRILTRIQNEFHFGRICCATRTDKKKPYSTYIVSTQAEMIKLIQLINGLIRIKVDSLKKACSFLGINYIPSNYQLDPWDPYFSGLIDTDGSINFNYPSNRIECSIEFKYNQYTKKLNLDYVIPYTKPYILLRKKKNQQPGRVFKSILFRFQTVNGMIPVYNYFMKCRLYSDFKFYRLSQIKKFILIRSYAKYPKDSLEFKIYSDFVLNWIQYKNPSWTKVPFITKLIF